MNETERAGTGFVTEPMNDINSLNNDGSQFKTTEPQLEQQPTSYNMGWQCPICGKVFSPWVTECGYCNESLITFESGTVEIQGTIEVK